MYEEFKHPNNDGLYAFVEVPISMLETLVPEAIPNSLIKSVLDEDGNEIEEARQKTMDEFILHKKVSLDNTKAIVLLAAKITPYGRNKAITIKDLNDWDQYLTPYNLNYSTGSWFNFSEYRKKIISEDYFEGI